MEFLMNYGWAILVILIAIGALSYFGVFDISKLMPGRCTFGTKALCKSFVYSDNGLELSLASNLKGPVIINKINVSSSERSVGCLSDEIGERWKSREAKHITINCDFESLGLIEGTNDKLDVDIEYIESGSEFIKTISGEVITEIGPLCIPYCTGRVCGSDGCDGYCGSPPITCNNYLAGMSELVSWWRFDDDPTDGVNDQRGLYPGSCANCPGYPAEGFDGGVSYDFDDGTNDVIDFGNIAEMDNVQEFTVSMWVNHDLITGHIGSLFTEYTDSNSWTSMYIGPFAGFCPDSGHICFIVSNGANFGYSDTSFSAATNTWQHHTMVYDGAQSANEDKVKFYLNGAEQSLTHTGTYPSTTANPPEFKVGGFNPGGSIDGKIDEVMVFNTALSASDVENIYNMEFS